MDKGANFTHRIPGNHAQVPPAVHWPWLSSQACSTRSGRRASKQPTHELVLTKLLEAPEREGTVCPGELSEAAHSCKQASQQFPEPSLTPLGIEQSTRQALACQAVGGKLTRSWKKPVCGSPWLSLWGRGQGQDYLLYHPLPPEKWQLTAESIEASRGENPREPHVSLVANLISDSSLTPKEISA